MDMLNKLLTDEWHHTDGDDRVEGILASRSDLHPRVQEIADTLIAEKGHDAAFADIHAEVLRMKADPQNTPPLPFGHLTDDGWKSMLSLRFISEMGLSDDLANRLEAAPVSDLEPDESAPSP